MPIIAVRPSLADYDHQPEATTGPWRALTLRVRVAVRRDALLRELAAAHLPGCRLSWRYERRGSSRTATATNWPVRCAGRSGKHLSPR
jgi:hypothetical protein